MSHGQIKGFIVSYRIFVMGGVVMLGGGGGGGVSHLNLD